MDEVSGKWEGGNKEGMDKWGDEEKNEDYGKMEE